MNDLLFNDHIDGVGSIVVRIQIVFAQSGDVSGKEMSQKRKIHTTIDLQIAADAMSRGDDMSQGDQRSGTVELVASAWWIPIA